MPLFHSNALHGRLGAVDRRRRVGRRSADRFSASGWLARRPPLRRHLLQLHGQAARVHPRPARARRRRRQHVAGRVRQRGRAAGRRGVRATLRRPRHRRVRRDRGRARGQPRRRVAARARSVAPARACKIVGDDGNENCPRADFDETGALIERRGVRRRDREHRGRRRVRGLLQQPRGERARPRASAGTGRATSATSTTRLPLLRRAQRRLDPRRRRELPGRPDRGRSLAPAPDVVLARGLRGARRPRPAIG